MTDLGWHRVFAQLPDDVRVVEFVAQPRRRGWIAVFLAVDGVAVAVRCEWLNGLAQFATAPADCAELIVENARIAAKYGVLQYVGGPVNRMVRLV